jgi:CheY-like chemotaxis protein
MRCIVLSPQSILVVDDDELLAQMVSELLQGEGFQVATARNGLQGYSSYYAHQAETILTDIDMPELDGFEMMRCIRILNQRVKAIYMSGAPEQYRRTLVSEAQNFGVTVLRKPFEEAELLKLVQSLEKANPHSHKYEWSHDQKSFVWKEAV